MNRISLLLIIQLAFVTLSFSQSVVAGRNIKLPEDSVILIKSLNNLIEKRSGIDPDFQIETSALLDEMEGMKFKLVNISPIDSLDFLIQLSSFEDGTFRSSFKLIAKTQGKAYFFSSPLRRNTLNWKIKKTGDFVLYRNSKEKTPLLYRYIRTAQSFDRKLKAPVYVTKVYYHDNFTDLMGLLGEEYKIAYNGIGSLNKSWYHEGACIILIGARTNDVVAFDLHDLWHDRLHHIVNVEIINRPIDEACAYLYGGSWGIYTWDDILQNFKQYMGADHNWLKAFDEHRKFGGVRTPLYADYVLDALICQKIEKEQGFANVITFLSCGKKEAGNANYFKALEKITGITRANFNVQLEKLVH
ncbi:hypothetical protein [Mucilaginibacter xinganensis]|uniref:Uncharacterized protein n=1 Tax=Mucilaginibacter xinganensis TaxID=1234841 RepID=A0A223P094_9SPHI|nr:hypothetical protein [Mucilaginibacter xinganensis]ASU35440.1 hypothetical protein MuYL_3555 [Mucilaginibacter xinganensis]